VAETVSATEPLRQSQLPVDALNLPGGRQGEMAEGDVVFFVVF